MNSSDQRFDTWIKQTQNPFINQNYSKSKIIKNLARTLSLFLIFTENVYKSKTKKSTDRTLLWKMIYNTSKWQSINKTNQKSKYLQFCRAKAYYVVQHMFLTEAVLTLLLYKTLAGYCTSIASQVRVTEWIWVRNSRYLYKTLFGLFYWGYNFTFRLQFHL